MTQHPADISRLPKDLRDMLPVEERKERQLTRPSPKVVDTAFRMFWSAMVPLREADPPVSALLRRDPRNFEISITLPALPNDCRSLCHRIPPSELDSR